MQLAALAVAAAELLLLLLSVLSPVLFPSGFLLLSLLLMRPLLCSAGGIGTSRESVPGGDAASPTIGTKDSKGEHVLVTLLERMKSLEGKAAAFRAL